MSDQIVVSVISPEQISVEILPEGETIESFLLENVVTGPAGPAGPASGLLSGADIPDPLPGDLACLGRVNTQTTVGEIRAVVVGESSPSVTLELRYGLDRSGVGTMLANSTEITNTSNGQTLTILNQPIQAGSWIWANILAVQGAARSVTITISA